MADREEIITHFLSMGYELPLYDPPTRQGWGLTVVLASLDLPVALARWVSQHAVKRISVKNGMTRLYGEPIRLTWIRRGVTNGYLGLNHADCCRSYSTEWSKEVGI